jgi:hypothetical protein
VNKDELRGYHGRDGAEALEEPKQSVGFFEGLKTLLGCPYVGGIFGLVFFHEVVSALMHYQMIRVVELTYRGYASLPGQGLVNKFLFDFTLVMQGIVFSTQDWSAGMLDRLSGTARDRDRFIYFQSDAVLYCRCDCYCKRYKLCFESTCKGNFVYSYNQGDKI